MQFHQIISVNILFFLFYFIFHINNLNRDPNATKSFE